MGRGLCRLPRRAGEVLRALVVVAPLMSVLSWSREQWEQLGGTVTFLVHKVTS